MFEISCWKNGEKETHRNIGKTIKKGENEERQENQQEGFKKKGQASTGIQRSFSFVFHVGALRRQSNAEGGLLAKTKQCK